MGSISRRSFLAAAAAVAVGGCAADAADPAPTSSPSLPADAAPDASTTTSATASSAPTSSAATTTPAPTTASTSATTSTSSAVPATSPPSAAPQALPPVDFADPFTLGVASGDPDPTSVVLWTRLAPLPLARDGGMPPEDVVVRWELSRDATFAAIERWGDETAVAAHGHSIHTVAELDGSEWCYRFRVGQHTSAVGRARATPSPGDSVERLTFASASCQNYEAGYYAAHRDLAEQRPDFVVWLGDYIYEAGAGAAGPAAVRSHGTPETTDLGDYRARYARYKTDPDLQAAHGACPWFVIWDDHEVQDNYASMTPKRLTPSGAFTARRGAAYQAWWEHMPVRLPPPTDPAGDYRIYRDVRWGDLVGIALLDGRQYRSDQACGDTVLDLAAPCAELTEPGRTMLGEAQERWLDDRLRSWGTTWNVLGNQTVLTDITVAGAVINYDQWDGYPAERTRILDHLVDAGVANVVVLTGDIHVSLVGQLRTGGRTRTAVGVEFVCSSISSGSRFSSTYGPALALVTDIVDAELDHRGYVLHTVTAGEWRAEYRLVDDARRADSAVRSHATYVVAAGTSDVHRAPS